jgi:hypothetical protein
MPTYQKIIWISLGVTAIAILALGYFLFLAPNTAEKSVPPTAMTSRAIPQQTEPYSAKPFVDQDVSPLDLHLDQSDPAVRDLIAAAQVPSSLREWSRQKELVRTAVAAVDNIALGQSPAGHFSFIPFEKKFLVIAKNGSYYLDPRGYQRYDPLIDVFMAIPTETLIFWFKKLRPTLDAAFRELGYPGITFSERLQQAIEQLLQVPLLNKDLLLEKKILSYAFADINLEELNPVQKHLLRMGPQNVARIQNKLRALAAGLGIFPKGTHQ